INQTRVPLLDVLIFELQFFACAMRRGDDEHVGPFDEFLENLLCARRFQIERYAALVAIGQVPLIGILCLRLRRYLVTNPPHVAGRRLHLNHVSAKIGQDYRGAWTSDEARQVHYFQSGKNVVSCHSVSLNYDGWKIPMHQSKPLVYMTSLPKWTRSKQVI